MGTWSPRIQSPTRRSLRPARVAICRLLSPLSLRNVRRPVARELLRVPSSTTTSRHCRHRTGTPVTLLSPGRSSHPRCFGMGISRHDTPAYAQAFPNKTRETVVATTILAVIGTILLVLNTAVRVPRAVAAFVRTLIPLVRALRTLRHEIDSKRASSSQCGTFQRGLKPGTRPTCNSGLGHVGVQVPRDTAPLAKQSRLRDGQRAVCAPHLPHTDSSGCGDRCPLNHRRPQPLGLADRRLRRFGSVRGRRKRPVCW